MRRFWIVFLGLTSCLPKPVTEEEEIARAKVELEKNPGRSYAYTPQKLTQEEVRQQMSRSIQNEADHIDEMTAISSQYRSG